MRIEQSGSVDRPITIGQQFFEQLELIISELQTKALRSIAARSSVPFEVVERLRQETEMPWFDPEEEKLESSAEVSAQIDRIRETHLESRVWREIDEEASISCTVRYDTGFSTQTNDLAQLKSLLKTESGNLDALSFAVGSGYRSLGFGLRLVNAERPASFDISGEREEVDHFYQSIIRLLQAAIPNHPWLYDQRLHLALALGLSTALAVTSIRLGGQLLGPGEHLATAEFAVILLSVALAVGIAVYILTQAAKVFPRLEVEFGPEWRRRRGRRTSLLIILTAIVLPLLMNIFV